MTVLEKIADEFDVSLDQLLGKVKSPASSPDAQCLTTKVPVLTWLEVSAWIAHEDAESHKTIEVAVPADPDFPKRYFALVVDSLVMAPVFPEGSIIVIDRLRKAANYDYVMVEQAKRRKLFLRQLFIESPQQVLKPINPNFKSMVLSEADKLLGVVCSTIKE